MSHEERKSPLTRIRVLDLGRFRSGPYCGQLLADTGAEVIRVEKRGGADDRQLEPFTTNDKSMNVLFTGRNKKGITLNLHSGQGRRILTDLVKHCDVLVHNYAPLDEAWLGLSYESLKAVNPSLILVAVSGFGSYGPYVQKRSFYPIAQAMSGIMSLTGFPESRPTKVGLNIADYSTGIYAAFGTVLALYHRRLTGEGQQVEVALFDAAVPFLDSTVAEYRVLGKVRPQLGNRSFDAAPSDAIRTQDGYVYIIILGDASFLRLVKILGSEELARDPRFASDRLRSHNWQPLNELVSDWAASRTVSQVLTIMEEARIPCGRVNSISEVATDAHLRTREMILEGYHPDIGSVPLMGNPVKLSLTPARGATRAPEVGEHNEEVYGGLLGFGLD